jgi:phosphate uptake regulator
MTPRAKFIAKASQKNIAQMAWDAMMMASSHDPDHAKAIRRLERWVDRLFRRVAKLEK